MGVCTHSLTPNAPLTCCVRRREEGVCRCKPRWSLTRQVNRCDKSSRGVFARVLKQHQIPIFRKPRSGCADGKLRYLSILPVGTQLIFASEIRDQSGAQQPLLPLWVAACILYGTALRPDKGRPPVTWPNKIKTSTNWSAGDLIKVTGSSHTSQAVRRR